MYSTLLDGGGMGEPSSRNPCRWNSMASRMAASVSARVISMTTAYRMAVTLSFGAPLSCACLRPTDVRSATETGFHHPAMKWSDDRDVGPAQEVMAVHDR